MAQLYWVELSLTSHHTQIWSYKVLLPPTSTAAAAHTLNCLYMGVYYTSVKRTQQLSSVTRIRTHDLLIRYLITKQWRPVLSQLGHHPNPKRVGSMAQLYWVELSLTSHHTQIWSYKVLLPPTSTAAAAHTLNYIYIQRITMCPHGYHHSGSMATPALGTRDVRLYIYIRLSL